MLEEIQPEEITLECLIASNAAAARPLFETSKTSSFNSTIQSNSSQPGSVKRHNRREGSSDSSRSATASKKKKSDRAKDRQSQSASSALTAASLSQSSFVLPATAAMRDDASAQSFSYDNGSLGEDDDDFVPLDLSAGKVRSPEKVSFGASSSARSSSSSAHGNRHADNEKREMTGESTEASRVPPHVSSLADLVSHHEAEINDSDRLSKTEPVRIALSSSSLYAPVVSELPILSPTRSFPESEFRMSASSDHTDLTELRSFLLQDSSVDSILKRTEKGQVKIGKNVVKVATSSKRKYKKIPSSTSNIAADVGSADSGAGFFFPALSSASATAGAAGNSGFKSSDLF